MDNRWFINVNDAANMLNVTPHYVRRLIHSSKLEWKFEEWLYKVSLDSLQQYKESKKNYFINATKVRPSMRIHDDITNNVAIKELIEKIEECFWGDLISYMSNFTRNNNSMIVPSDCMQLDDLLNLMPSKFPWNWDKKFKKILLYISSPWWILEASVKFVDIIRQYSESFEVIVPYMAKSAASFICLSSDKIYMTTISELWPIDPIIENPTMPWNFIPARAIDDFIEYYSEEANKWGSISNALSKIFENKIDPYILWSRKNALLYSQNEIKEALKWKVGDRLLGNVVNVFTTDNVSHNHPITYNNLQKMWLKNVEQVRNWDALNYIKMLFSEYNNYMNRNNIAKTFWSRNRNYDFVNNITR